MSERKEIPDLFPSLAIPKIHDGESLYSWCARFHQLSCNSSPRKTSQQLFDHPSSGLHPNFPTPLGVFHEKSGGQLGTLEDLIFRRTLFGFYRPFLSAPRATALKIAIEANSYGKVHYILGLAASLPNGPALLKACPGCIQEDRVNSPSSWWRIEHQWPAIFVCAHHQQPLLQIKKVVSEESSKIWILPDHVDEQNGWHEMPPIKPGILLRIAEISKWCSIISKSSIHLETTKLRYSYLLEAKNLGYVSMDGSARLIQLRDNFSKWLGDCSTWPGLSFTTEIHDVNAGFIGQLLRQYPGMRHPLKHILMIAHLFQTTETFFERYEEVSEMLVADGPGSIKHKLTNIRDSLVKLVRDNRRSVNSVAAELGLSVTQATKFLNKTKVPYQNRPRIAGTEKEISLIHLLKGGKERIEICQELGILNGYIKDYLAKHPEIRASWEKARRENLVARYRKNFLRLLQANPGVPTKKLKSIPGNGIQWLQRNDRKWLEDKLLVLSCSSRNLF
jgi:Tn7-like transposition protein D/TniQ